jgi:hypothetical protein
LTTNLDKKSVCLVCKEMAFVTTPLLYRNMVIHTDCLNEDLESTLLDPGAHRGLIHTRTLRVNTEYSDEYFDRLERNAIITALCALLKAIPENALTRFE